MKYSKEFKEEKIELFELLKEGCGLEKLLKAAYRHLENPVIMNDASYQALASYGGELEKDTYTSSRSALLMNDEILNRLHREEFPQELQKAQGAYLGFQKNKNRYLLLCPVRIRGAMAGFLCVLPQNHKHSAEDVAYTDILCDAVRITLMNSIGSSYGMNLNCEYLLSGLMNGVFETESQIDHRFEILNLRKSACYVLCMIRSDLKAEQSRIPGSVFQNIRRFLPEAVVSWYQDVILLLCGVPLADAILLPEQEKLEPLLESQQLSMIVSNKFTHLLQFPLYYKQIKKLNSFVEEFECKGTIFTVQHYFLPFLSYSANTRQSIQALIPIGIYQLISYDQKNRTDYLNTLTAFLREKNVSQAAEKLNIHKTTLTYRMEKIMEIIGSDIDELQDERLQLLISITLLNYSMGSHGQMD